MVDHCIMIITNNQAVLEKTQYEWQKDNIVPHGVKDIRTTPLELINKNYVLITIFADAVGDTLLNTVRFIRSVSTIPIQIITSSYRIEEQNAAIKLGADQYFAMPNTTEEYVVAGLALIRRYMQFDTSTPSPPLMLEHCGLLLCVDYFRVFIYGREVELTPKEYKILHILLEQRHRVVTYSQIYRKIWGEEYEDDPQRAITNLVSKLRKKLKVDSSTPDYIKNIHAIGYRFDP